MFFRGAVKKIANYRNSLFQNLVLNKVLRWNCFFLQKHYAPFARSKKIHKLLKKKNGFLKVLIIRGIGYRAFTALNDFGKAVPDKFFLELFYNKLLYSLKLCDTLFFEDERHLCAAVLYELAGSVYLILRVGHTTDASWCVSADLRAIKKNRKLVVLSGVSAYTGFITNCVWRYRRPSVYTGRGVRKKKIFVARKKGKKDQKGRGF